MTHFSDAPHPASRPENESDGEISISVRATPGGTAATIRGELDVASVTHVRTALLQVLEECVAGGVVTLDLSQVTFCDSTGLNVLLRARRWALDEHRALIINAASPQMARLLDMTGAAPLFAEKT
ncbi:STAS domain-containing protein [Streptomyces sp. NPDC057027]|uniref:STAS domain-containing protein n=1 Tax=Streptomyces sp. NPDC057027 TaxID=3346004 RepID=UPI003644018A